MNRFMPTTNSSPSLRSSTASYDVIVVGARAAGAATAMLLARAGLRTLLIDRSPFCADTLSTHALMRGGVAQLTQWGLIDQIVAAGTPAVKRTTFTYGEEQIVISIKPKHGVDALYAPRRTVLDTILVRAAIDAGVEFHDRTTVTDLITRAGRVVGVQVSTNDTRSVSVQAPLVVGADGIRSTVARRVDSPFTRLGDNATATTYGYWTDLDTDGYEWVFRPNGCCGVIPTNAGQACVFAGATPQRIGAGGLDVLLDIVSESAPELAERLGRAVPPTGTRSWPGRRGYIRHSFGPGWTLVGDAGYFKDPIGAHGLTDALRDADLIARAIIAGHGDTSTLTAELGQYQSIRDQLSTPLFDVVDKIASQQWDASEIADLLLRLNSAMAAEIEALVSLDGYGR